MEAVGTVIAFAWPFAAHAVSPLLECLSSSSLLLKPSWICQPCVHTHPQPPPVDNQQTCVKQAEF